MVQEFQIEKPYLPTIQSVADSEISSNTVRVKTHLTSSCHGEDYKIFCGKHPQIALSYPYTLPTWGCGEIVEVGEKVLGLREGMLVHGPMLHRDVQVLPANRLYPVEWIRKEFTLFTHLGGLVLHVIRNAGIRYGDSVLITGLGTLGLLGLQFAQLSGAARIWGIDPCPNRQKLAIRLGATNVSFPSLNTSLDSSSHDIAPNSCDVAIDFSGESAALHATLHAIRPQGRMVVLGCAYPQTTLQKFHFLCDQHQAKFHPVSLKTPSPFLEKLMIDAIVSKKIVLWPLISHCLSFESIPEHFEKILKNPDEYHKVMVIFPESKFESGPMVPCKAIT